MKFVKKLTPIRNLHCITKFLHVSSLCMFVNCTDNLASTETCKMITREMQTEMQSCWPKGNKQGIFTEGLENINNSQGRL